MCGIVGVAGKILQRDEAIFKTLLCLDTIRGPHSTGIAAIANTGYYDIFKKTGTPWDCFDKEPFEKLFKYMNALLIGHNRWATVGEITDKNAHPFDVGDIIGAHNGTIKNQKALVDHEYFDVDSENIFYSFDKVGVEETVKLLNGAFAIVFYKRGDATVHFLRNEDRPLFYTLSKDHKTIYWASEAWMLSIALGRHGVEYEPILQFETLVDYSLPIPKEEPYKCKELPEFTKVKLEEFKKPVAKYAPWGGPGHIPFGRAVQNQAMNESLYRKLNKFVNKFVMFQTVGFVPDKANPFIRAYAITPTPDVVEVRLFIPQNDKKFSALMNKTTTWEGRVKRCTPCGETHGYLVMDNRSLGEVVEKKDHKPPEPRESSVILLDSVRKETSKEKPWCVVFGGIPVTTKEWLLQTACGCDNCGTIPQIQDLENLYWYENEKFFCKNCINLQKVQQFLYLNDEEGGV